MKFCWSALFDLLINVVSEVLAVLLCGAIFGFAFHMFYDYGIAWEFNLPELGFNCCAWGAFCLFYLIFKICNWIKKNK